MRVIRVIGWNTLREWIREKFFWVAVAISFFLMLLSIILGQLTFAEEQKIMTDFGFSAIEISLLIVASFSGAYVIANEVEKQTCLLLLARPLSRTHFLMGKCLGLTFLLTLLFLTCTVVLYFLIGQSDQTLRFIAISLSFFFKGVVILCFTMMASLFLRPVLSLIAGISIYFFGHWLDDLFYFAQKSQNALYIYASEALRYVIPQFYRFNWKSYYFLENGFDHQAYLSMLLHYLSWCLIYLFVADFLFRRKDIV